MAFRRLIVGTLFGLCLTGANGAIANEQDRANEDWKRFEPIRVATTQLAVAKQCGYPADPQVVKRFIAEKRKAQFTPELEAAYLVALQKSGKKVVTFDEAFDASATKLASFVEKNGQAPNERDCAEIGQSLMVFHPYDDYRRAAGLKTFDEAVTDAREQAELARDPLFNEKVDGGFLRWAMVSMAASDTCEGWPGRSDAEMTSTAKELKAYLGLSDATRENAFVKAVGSMDLKTYTSFEDMVRQRVVKAKPSKEPCGVRVKRMYSKGYEGIIKAWAPPPTRYMPVMPLEGVTPPAAPAPKPAAGH